LGIPITPSVAAISSSGAGACRGDEFDRFAKAKARAISAFEFGYLNEVIRRSQGNVTLAAKISGTERRQLGKLLKKHGIIPEDGRNASGWQQREAGMSEPVQRGFVLVGNGST
jgi:DNA-binding NtrC family response regulator